jgi:hypothetical protein
MSRSEDYLLIAGWTGKVIPCQIPGDQKDDQNKEEYKKLFFSLILYFDYYDSIAVRHLKLRVVPVTIFQRLCLKKGRLWDKYYSVSSVPKRGVFKTNTKSLRDVRLRL